MEIISSVGLAASPFLIKWITSLFKNFTSRYDWTSGQKNVVLKFFVALCSFGVVIGTAAANGGVLDEGAVSVLANTVVVFVATTGLYFWSKYRAIRQ